MSSTISGFLCSSGSAPAARRADRSGAQMRTESATLFHVRDGKVTRLVVYWDREPALTHLGLEG